MNLPSLLTLLLLPVAVAAAGGKEARVLIIGIDGLRPDALELAETPHLDRLIEGGLFADDALILGDYRENDTVSGASWSTILTGVWADKHGVHDNTFRGAAFEQFPHFFERIQAVRSEAKTVSMVSWEPIDRFIVSAAELRHVERLQGGELVDLQVSANTVGVNTRDGEWHHLAGRKQDGIVSIFLNGQLVGETEDVAGDFALTGDYYYVGRDARLTEGVFTGETERVRLWNRALADSEIGRLEIEPDGLLADYRGAVDGLRIPLTPELAALTQGDWTIEAWFRTTDRARQILIGNHIRGANALNLELQTNNRVRIFMSPRWSRIDREYEMDTRMATAAAKILGEDDPVAMFVYFHQTDLVGHSLGFSPEVARYMEAVENVDRHVGRVIDAIHARETFPREDWMVIVCTDHGGLGYRHGGGHDDPEIIRVPLIVHGGEASAGRSQSQVYLVDIVPTALSHLGIPLDPAWRLDGKSLVRSSE